MPHHVEEILRETLDAGYINKQDRARIAQSLAHLGANRKALSQIRDMAFEMARAEVPSEHHITLNWLETLMKAMLGQTALPEPDAPVVCFSPGEECRQEIISQIQKAQSHMDICVFTITDNNIADPILDAHRRGVRVRIITDCLKSDDLGSDIEPFHRAGISVKIDEPDKHMHHKFAIFDGKQVLTGSYNWTRAAALENEENIVVLRDSRAVQAFSKEFDELWREMTSYSPGR